MLPPSLLCLCLLSAGLVIAQATQTLSLNAVASITPTILPNPPTFSLPTSDQLAVSIAVCSGNTTTSLPRFFVTNDTSSGTPSSSGGKNVFEIGLNAGMGGWTGVGSGGGLLAVENAGQTSFEIGVSSGSTYFHFRYLFVLDESIFWIQIDSSSADLLHQHLEDLPFLGDTTSNQALLFSPSFAPAPSEQPSWPQYTLPSANLSAPVAPSSSNFTLLISPTSSNLAAVPQTGCRLRATQSSGNQQGGGSWLLDSNGWRQQWLVDGLSPATNYTVFVIENNTTVSGPINIVTKSGMPSGFFICASPHQSTFQRPSHVLLYTPSRTVRQYLTRCLW